MRKFVVTAGLLLASLSASAAPIPFLELSNFRVEVSDLNAGDGIDAGYTLTTRNSFVFANVNFDPLFNSNLDLLPGETGSVALNHPLSRPSASFDGNTYRTSIDHINAWTRAQAGTWHTFSATPFTRLTFLYDYAGLNSPDPAKVHSTGMMHIYSNDLSSNIEGYLSDLPYQLPAKGIFSLDFETGADGVMDMTLFTELSTFGWGFQVPANPVPAPGSIALLLAGLAGLVAVRRKGCR